MSNSPLFQTLPRHELDKLVFRFPREFFLMSKSKGLTASRLLHKGHGNDLANNRRWRGSMNLPPASFHAGGPFGLCIAKDLP